MQLHNCVFAQLQRGLCISTMTKGTCKNTKDKRTEGEDKVDVLICDNEVRSLTFLNLQFFSLSLFFFALCPITRFH